MEEIAQHCSQRELAALEAERAADDLKKCEYMKDRIGTVETGIISGVAQYGFFVQLPNTVEGMVRIGSMGDDYYILDEQNYRMVGRSTGKTYRLGDQVTIRVTGADLETGNVDFILERDAGNGGGKRETEVSDKGRRHSQPKGKTSRQGGKAQASHKVEAVSGEKKSPGIETPGVDLAARL